MTPLLGLLLLLTSPPVGGYVAVSASFVPASKPGASPSVAVTLTPRDPDVRVNEEPAPRLKLDAEEAVLARQAASAGEARPSTIRETAKYLDPARARASRRRDQADRAEGEARP